MTPFNPYFDRDLSWLSFNERILREAADARVPLYDRIMLIVDAVRTAPKRKKR